MSKQQPSKGKEEEATYYSTYRKQGSTAPS